MDGILTFCGGVEKVFVLVQGLELLRAIRNLVVRVDRGSISNEDASNLIRELLSDLRICAEKSRG